MSEIEINTLNKYNSQTHSGVLSRFKTRLKQNRLGELLVMEGVLSPAQLDIALEQARDNGLQLGRVLVNENIVQAGVIQRTLMEQMIIRFLLAATAIVISVASFGFAKQAKAGQVLDVPGKISLVQESFEQASYYPKLFGSTEKRSSSLKAFTKWTTMFERFNNELNSSSGQKEIAQLKQELESFQNLPLTQMVNRVNALMNSKRYVSDSNNYGQTDYWATPVEFFQRGGDCEDYAIAKYTALRMLGVPENRLRIAIVQDMQKNIPHAVLIVYTDQGAMVLDNQIKSTVSADNVRHYKPIFSINQNAWWLHTKPKSSITHVASSSR